MASDTTKSANDNPTESEGFCHRFVEETLSDYECSICIHVARNPVQLSQCGHLFCKYCLNKWISTAQGGAVVCPVDKAPIDPKLMFDDKRLERTILNLKVYCDNSGQGCPYIGELNKIQDHLAFCKFHAVDCPQMCGERVMLTELDQHTEEDCQMRTVICETCKLNIPVKDEITHADVCPLALISCEYCPTRALFKRKDIDIHHKGECSKFPTLCSMAMFGCTDKVGKDVLQEHHETMVMEHLQFLHRGVLQLYRTLGVLPDAPPSNMHEMPVSLRDVHKNYGFPWKIVGNNTIGSAQQIEVPEINHRKREDNFNTQSITQKINNFVTVVGNQNKTIESLTKNVAVSERRNSELLQKLDDMKNKVDSLSKAMESLSKTN